MTTTLERPKRKAKDWPMPPPMPVRWDCDAFHRLCSTGVFDGSRAILIDGEILTMPMAAPPHNACMTKTDRWLNKVFASGCYVRNQQALNVGTKNDPGPDFAVVPGTEDDYADRQPTTALLVVEVADSSFETDTLVKPHLYAQAGVPEYWVIELNERRLHVYRDPMADESAPRGFRYASIAVLGETDGIAPQAAQDHVVVVADLLPKE